MKADQIRSQRLNTLLIYYKNNKYNDFLLFQRAKRMGVSDNTARDYLKTIKARLSK